MIYLSIPYSGMEELSFEVSCLVAAFLMKTGRTVYSPIVHGHILATKYELPVDHDFWLKHDLDMLQRCDEIYVVTLYGWDKSRGVRAELEEARKIDMPVTFIEPGPFISELSYAETR